MATAKFFTTAKRHNSTLIPTGGTVLNVSLKNGCDLLAPTFYLDYASVPAWSMMQFAGRYYFITGVTSLRQDYWQIDAEVDVLATYKSNIQATTAFVLYDASVNSEIIDNRLAMVTTKTTQMQSVGLDPSLFRTGGTFAVSVVGQQTSAVYLITSVNDLKNLVTPSSLEEQVTDELDDIDTGLSGDLLSDICKSINGLANVLKKSVKMETGTVNMYQYIKSVVWYPWQFAIDGAVQEVYLGDFKSVYRGAPVVNPLQLLESVDVPIPWQASDWRRNAPYTHVYVYLPFIGEFEIPSSEIIGETSLTALYSVNKYNGNLNCELHTSGGAILGYFSAQTGLQVPIGTTTTDFANMATSVLQGVGAAAAASAGQFFPAAAMAANSIASAKPITSFIGGGSGGAASRLDISVRCWTVFHNTSVEPNTVGAVIGTPTMAHHSLAQKTGYVQTQDASVGGSMTDTERQRINQLLDGGIYIE